MSGLVEYIVCPACQTLWPVEDYYVCGGKRQAYCKRCSVAKSSQWRRDNPERAREAKRRRYHANIERSREKQRATRRPSRYGLTPEQYASLVALAGGRCQLCGEPETRKHRGEFVPLSVDHDHRCCPGRKACGSCVRGLLCNSCNNGLLPAVENKPELQSARVATYLSGRAFPCQQS